MLHALIMAGGGGTRFWPRSRAKRPKQFLTLAGDRSLLQQAFERIEAQVTPQRTWVITSADNLSSNTVNRRSKSSKSNFAGESSSRELLRTVLEHQGFKVTEAVDGILEGRAQPFGTRTAGCRRQRRSSSLPT